MTLPGPDDRLYPAAKIVALVRSLQDEGIAPVQVLEQVGLTEHELTSPATRVSLHQVIRCYRNVIRLSDDPGIAYRIGLRFHVSAFGMYGFAILSSTDFRRTMSIGLAYAQLVGPVATLSFKEVDNRGVWTVTPVGHVDIDAKTYQFIVELKFGILTALHRDVMGPLFAPLELHVTYGLGSSVSALAEASGARVQYALPENEFVFDSEWLDKPAVLGNEATLSQMIEVCNQLMTELRARSGVAGKVRELLLPNLARPLSFDAIAGTLAMTTRTLRRVLRDENTSFRQLIDELRTDMAVKFLLETDLTVDQIGYAVGFSDVTGFRQAFDGPTSLPTNTDIKRDFHGQIDSGHPGPPLGWDAFTGQLWP